MRIKLGILAPLFLQIGIVYLYQTIKYAKFDNSLYAMILILVFPVLILAVLAPFIIIYFGNLDKRVGERLTLELDKLIFENPTTTPDFEDPKELARTLLKDNLVVFDDRTSTISSSMKSKLVPSLTKRALRHYKDNFYSRDERINPVKSLEYFEALVLFSSLTFILFATNLLIIILMYYYSLDLFFIFLDRIEEPSVLTSLIMAFLVGTTAAYLLFLYTRERLIYYLPYVIPVLFYEPQAEQYFRRETIRSLMSYNMDNLIDRRDQKKYRDTLISAVNNLLIPLLRDEFLITARTEFARSIAWREYSGLIISEADEIKEHPYLSKLFMGEKVGSLRIEEKDLLGLNSDFDYILKSLDQWKTLSKEKKIIIYFQTYRLIEYVYREIVVCLNLYNEDVELNLFNSMRVLSKQAILGEEDNKILHNLRYRRNKLMHEPGVSLDVSSHSIREVLTTLEQTISQNLNGQTKAELSNSSNRLN